MSSPELLSRVAAAKRAVLAQVDLLHREFGRAESHWKSDGTRVTPVDIAISEGIFRELGAQFPSDQYFSEELSNCDAPLPVTARFSWVLDPVDGTNNFALGIAHCAIALALCENGEPVYGVVYDLSRRTLMHGGPGFGALDGDREIHVASGPVTKETLVGFHSPFDKRLTPLAAGIISNFKIRGLGSATLHLAYVAAGMLDGCLDYNVKIWDLAAAIPLVRAAGGEVRFLNGEQLPLKQFDLKMRRIIYVAGGPKMCARLAELVTEGDNAKLLK
ncbi:inositol monophosphatase [Opitutus sp. ER46]|uniref:inositol monophosphatase family protein n=1 Tax=Opitutus sp. ER46 TaxID=2161864 RepID=UPI000D319D55|nr:inositol monophosphatase [Opitutus sp. ER46]PTX99036.1 inositol monophosphatase [Opitutus sp. ER46]